MGNQKFFVNKLHHSSKRNYLKRMINQKVKGMNIATKYGYDYWDGNESTVMEVTDIYQVDGRVLQRNLLKHIP